MPESYVGRPIPRVEGMDKASGTTKYAGDYRMPGMLHLKLVGAPVAHGKLLSVTADGLPENALLFTAKDLPLNLIEDVIEDRPVLVAERIRFLGEPVALVAADSEALAERAAKQVRVNCAPLPVVEDPAAALAQGAPLLHEGGNLLTHFENEKGSVAEGFAKSHLILEDHFYTPIQDHACMEPEAAFCYIDEEGRLVAYTSTQNVFSDQRMICRALSLPPEKVRVIAAAVGGGFGGKDGHTVQLFAALVCWATKRPARIVLSRAESLATTFKRHSADIQLKIGFSEDGSILAFDGSALLDTGAYAALGPAVLGLFTEHFAGPYNIPNVRVASKLLYTNKPPAHAMRGFGAPQGAFATETLISRAAVALGLDPLDIRRKNALHFGETGTLGQKMEHCVGLQEALALVERSDLWQEYKTNPQPGVGYGIAAGHLSCGLGKNIPDTAKAEVSELSNGRVRIHIGMVDIGQGSRTALHAMAADELGLPFEAVGLEMADTDTTHDSGSTAGSRSTFIAGNAMLRAIEAYKANKQCGGPGPHIGSAAFPESGTTFSLSGFPHAMYTFIAQAVKLRLDPVTGAVELLDIFGATEAGRIINPLSMDGQIQGGVAMSVGYALGEDCRFEEGRLLNPDFATYLLPTAMDLPPIACVHVDSYENSGPMGVKGAAEVATVSIAPAIGAAITQLSGAAINRLPIDIEGLWLQHKANTAPAEHPSNITKGSEIK